MSGDWWVEQGVVEGGLFFGCTLSGLPGPTRSTAFKLSHIQDAANILLLVFFIPWIFG
jgi:hypothetical protein